MTLLRLEDLHVTFRLGRDDRGEQQVVQAVKGVSFDIPANTTVALVGESGSGKSVTAMSILNLLPDNAERRGRILWNGTGPRAREGSPPPEVAVGGFGRPGAGEQDLLQASTERMLALRGREIACVFQDPMSSLNPVFPVGEQVVEPLMRHLGLSKRQAMERAEQLFVEVGLPDPKRRLSFYPHEMSGGQQQRVMIAMALACEPKLLIADEPTTALDVTIQRQILELIEKIQKSHHMSVLFISHDLGVVGEIADHVVVMRHGVVREQGPVARIFTTPQDPYTQALLSCRPGIGHVSARLPVIDDHMAGRKVNVAAKPKDPNAPVVLEVQALAKSFFLREGLFRRKEFKAVSNVNFKLRKGHTLGVVGESGSGKTTMGLTLLRLHVPTGGKVFFDGRDLLELSAEDRQVLRRRIQIVFQNPYASLNPRFTIAQTLVEPMEIHRIGKSAADRAARAMALLAKVGLETSAMGKYPHEFSGGQRQRIAIARALTLDPEVLVLDEAVSALDVSVQAQVLNLLRDLQDDLGLAYVFISHDLGVVRFLADEVLVMKDGVVVEQDRADALMAAPREEYTRRLMAALPRGYRAAT